MTVVSTLGVWALLVAMAHAPINHLVVDPQRSNATVHVGKEGIFAFAGDNHTVNVPISSGFYDPHAKMVELHIRTADIKAVDPQLSPDRRAKVQANMTGPQVLDVQKYPEIMFRSTKIDDSNGGHWTVAGALTLHGQTHPVTFAVTKIDGSRFQGSTTLRQTTFGITPIKIAGGTVRVKDELKIEFDVVLKTKPAA